MFDPDPTGRIAVVERSGIAGGHEYEVEEIDVPNGRVWLTNSWGSGWGIEGRAWMDFLTFGALLKQGGDAIQPIR